ncbi:hypothetical protein [Providencia rettgeri]|uniref:hypothetical protein n=1 Tax=Providencia rettgeri TaxID=587 RepID=UPI000BC7E2CD|nr:hypothetical protein [Providencia rettgeri]PCQ37020.1 hypothetical protein CQA26_15775 [Providencia rettgeri]
MFKFLKSIFSKEKANITSTSDKKIDDTSRNHAFNMINNEATIWQGTLPNISFSYYNDDDKKQRVSGDLRRIYLHSKGDFFVCIDVDNVALNINENHIDTLFLYKSSRYNLVELFRNVLRLENQKIFEYANYIRDLAATPKIIKEMTPLKTEFTYAYRKGDERVRDKCCVYVDQYLVNDHGFEYISGLNVSDNKRLYFSKTKIDTMLSSEGHKKYKFDDWLVHVFGVKVDVNN